MSSISAVFFDLFLGNASHPFLYTLAALMYYWCIRGQEISRPFCLPRSFTCKTQLFLGGPDETRTRDLCHAKAALSQLSYGPKKASTILAVKARIARRKSAACVARTLMEPDPILVVVCSSERELRTAER